MIRAIMFDLDGTLVQSEKLKAQSYAIAAQRLLGTSEPDVRAVEAYREIVGAERHVASKYVMEQLDLEPYLHKQMEELGVSSPEEALSALRVAIYSDMVDDPQVFRDNQWPHTVGLLRIARDSFCQTALVTMSQRPEALKVVRALDLESTLDLILTREDVEKPKPDPEIYLLAAKRFNVPPEECLVLEDSPAGARAAVAAGTNVVAVATPFTAAGHQREQVVPEAFVVTELEKLLEVVQQRILEHNRTVHGYDTPRSPICFCRYGSRSSCSITCFDATWRSAPTISR